MDNEQRDFSREFAIIPTNQSDTDAADSGSSHPERRERSRMDETDFSSSRAVSTK